MDRPRAALIAEDRLGRRSPPLLRTARLDAVGYGALGGACLAAAAVSALALRWTGRPPAGPPWGRSSS